jgi:hypothetical protein
MRKAKNVLSSSRAKPIKRESLDSLGTDRREILKLLFKPWGMRFWTGSRIHYQYVVSTVMNMGSYKTGGKFIF